MLDTGSGSNIHQGDPELLEAINRVRPRLHLFGHIHPGYGIYESEQTTFVNAALLGPGGDINNEPITLRMTCR
ncbi:hypothetical protein [Alloacidobacterium dinghuense]|uniref:hypothetical protein n=1 Tax=Alloacidobacterium dinghuense TaxID=2763107 RepID=UPI003D807513